MSISSGDRYIEFMIRQINNQVYATSLQGLLINAKKLKNVLISYVGKKMSLQKWF